MTFGGFIIGLIVVVFGVLMLKYTFNLTNFTGNVGFAEKYLGAGGTYSLYKILGIVLCLGGIMAMFGLFEPVARWALSPLAPYFKINN
jgi:hypothetical protein